MTVLMLPDTRQQADERLLHTIRFLERLCAEPTPRARLEAELGAELTDRLLPSLCS